VTPAEAAKCVAMLQAAYPAARWSEPTIDLYELMLADLDYAVARDALVRIIKTQKFLPAVAEVLEAAADVTVGPMRSAVDAWGDVGMAIRQVGYIGVPRFADPIVADCVRAMGWRNLCLGDSPEAADRARFCEMYQHKQREQRVLDVTEPGRLLPAHTRPPELLPPRVRELMRGVGR
jgi:Loader and inhibitor of phage G40P